MSVGSREFDHPGLAPLVIDLIPDQTRAELEASIDAPLAIERWPSGWENGDKTENRNANETADTVTGPETPSQ